MSINKNTMIMRKIEKRKTNRKILSGRVEKA